jgi:two-component system, LytTR family, response regulator
VHRSSIVNIKFIRETRSLLNGDYVLVLKNGNEIRASRTYRERLRSVLGKL